MYVIIINIISCLNLICKKGPTLPTAKSEINFSRHFSCVIDVCNCEFKFYKMSDDKPPTQRLGRLASGVGKSKDGGRLGKF